MNPCYLRTARGEPLDLLKLDPVPRRVADNCVEPTIQQVIFPIGPDTRESDLPIEEVFFGNQSSCFFEYFSKPLVGVTFDPGIAFAHGNGQRITKLPVEKDFQRGFSRLVLDADPFQRVDKFQ